jgi:hypothetical protein
MREEVGDTLEQVCSSISEDVARQIEERLAEAQRKQEKAAEGIARSVQQEFAERITSMVTRLEAKVAAVATKNLELLNQKDSALGDVTELQKKLRELEGLEGKFAALATLTKSAEVLNQNESALNEVVELQKTLKGQFAIVAANHAELVSVNESVMAEIADLQKKFRELRRAKKKEPLEASLSERLDYLEGAIRDSADKHAKAKAKDTEAAPELVSLKFPVGGGYHEACDTDSSSDTDATLVKAVQKGSDKRTVSPPSLDRSTTILPGPGPPGPIPPSMQQIGLGRTMRGQVVFSPRVVGSPRTLGGSFRATPIRTGATAAILQQGVVQQGPAGPPAAPPQLVPVLQQSCGSRPVMSSPGKHQQPVLQQPARLLASPQASPQSSPRRIRTGMALPVAVRSVSRECVGKRCEPAREKTM